MGNDNAEVRLGADTSGLKSNMADGAASVRTSLTQIGDYLKRVASDGKSSETELKQVLDSIKRGFSDTAQDVGTSSEKIATSVKVMRAGIAGAAFAIGASLALAFKGIRDLEEEAQNVEQLQRVFGMTSDEAARMNVALQLAGKTTADYTGVALNLGRQIKVDEDRIRALGVVTRDATTGAFLPMNEVMKNAFATMQTYKLGVDQNEFALEAFGRSAKDVYGLFEVNGPIMERAAQLQRELGIEFGADKRAAVKAYTLESRAMGIVWGEMRQTLGEQLMPTLKALTQWFASIAPSAMTVFSGILKITITVLEGFGAVVATVVIGAVATFENLMTSISAVGRAFMAFVRGDWGAIPGIMATSAGQIKANQQAAADSVRAAWTSSYDRIKNVWSTPPIAAGGGTDTAKGGTRSWVAKPGKEAADPSQMSKFEAMLKAERDAYERMKLEQGSFERWSEEHTSAFWERIKATYELSAKDLQAIESKWYDAQRVIRQKAFDASIASLEAEKNAIKFNYDERIRLAEEAARRIALAYGAGSREAIAAEAKVTQEIERRIEQQTRLAEVQGRVEAQRAEHAARMSSLDTGQQLAMQQINAEQAIALEAQTQERLFQIKLAAYKKTLSFERDPVKIAAINAEIEALEATHQERMTELANQAARERAQYSIQAVDAVKSAMGTMLSDMATGTKTAKQAFMDMIKSIEKSLADLAAKKLMEQILGAGTGGGGILGSFFGSIFGGGSSIMGGGISGFGGMIPAFSAGTPYVPQTGLAMIHKGERIVDARTNAATGGAVINANINIPVNGPVDSRTRGQIAAAVSQGIEEAKARYR